MSILRWTDGSRVTFYCPGCKETHAVPVCGTDGWTFNGDLDKPTLSPSILRRSGHFVPGHSGACWCTYNAEHPEEDPFLCLQCHSFVKDGFIQFLGDCSHALAGQTVALPEWPL